MIDMGGSLKIKNDDTIENFKINTYPDYTISPYFCAPELDKDKNPKLSKNKTEYNYYYSINIAKSLAYTSGKII